jgi:hypothetical protein
MDVKKKPAQQAEIPNDQSLEAIRALIYEALKALMPDATSPSLYMEQVYPDRAIVRDAQGALWEYPYTIAAGAVALGERRAVQVAYVPASQAAAAGDTRVLQALDQEGWQWEVLIIQPGMGANRQYFPAETLQASVPVFEGAQVFCLDDSQHSRTGDKSAKQIVGWIAQPEWREAHAMQASGQPGRAGIYGRLTLLKGADWLRQNLLDSHAKGKWDLYGLSVDAPRCLMVPKTIQQAEGPVPVQWFTKFYPPASVDVVWRPGTPGGFQRALNAECVQPTTEEERMKERLLQLLQAKRPDLYATVNQAEVTDEQLLALLGDGLTPVKQAETKPAERTVQNATLSAEDRAVIDEAKRSGWNAKVAQAIVDSKLPEAMQKTLRGRYLDHVGEFTAVEQAIKGEKEEWAAISQSGNVRGLGFAHDVAVEGEAERLQASMDKLFGVDNKSDAPSFRSIRQAYVQITGDTELVGRITPGHERRVERIAQAIQAFWRNGIGEPGYENPGFVRVEQAQAAGNWPTILGNTLYRRLAMEYAAVDYSEGRIISNRRRASDYRTLEVQRTQYPADLTLFNPEVADYPEAATLGEEQVNYAVGTRGQLITVTRKTIINDDLGAVARLPRLFGRAARRTFARSVWNLFMANATYDGDAVAWFHASHNNLGATALTADATGVTALVTRLNALMAQTEPGSGEKLGGAWWGAKPMLAVPTQLQAIAKQLNQSDGIPGTSNNGDNPVRGLFGKAEAPENILVNPLFTDATDWGLFRQPTDMDIVEAAFLNGQETPELFIADQQTVGQMFVADKLQYKIRFEYGVELLDFRSADKSVVAG